MKSSPVPDGLPLLSRGRHRTPRRGASLTEVEYSPVETIVSMVTPPDFPAFARYSFALATSRVGHGRSFGSDL